MSERFYLNWPLNPGLVEMTGAEARHLATVCRLRAGDEICLFNGDGNEYPARVVATSKKSVSLEILSVAAPPRELGFSLEIAAAVPKGDRAQFLVEKLTELGVTAFVPLLCRRSVVQPRENTIDKLARYVIEASKQCGRNVLMCIEEPRDWATYCSRGEPGELRIVAHPSAAAKKMALKELGGSKIRCAVGPEGGFTDEEIALALSHDWHPMELGPRILRVETAALVLATNAILLASAMLDGEIRDDEIRDGEPGA
jgi:16S rRNA (uracil1498-N3)-methyltransferase